MILSLGVILSVYVLFFGQINFVYSVINMLIFAEPVSDAQIYSQVITPIRDNNNKVVDIVYPQYGDKFAELSIAALKKDGEAVFNCDDFAQLKYGWGKSAFARFPGEGGKIVFAGHSFLNKSLFGIKVGTTVSLKTAYGTFHYKVVKKKVVAETDPSVLEVDDSHEQLLLYVCYPLYSVSRMTQRLVIYCDFVSGPTVQNIPFK